MEPITLFARRADPAGVAGLLRKRVPSAVIDGPDASWRSAVIAFGRRRLTLNHNPEYYAEPNWSMQMNGMRGYFAQFPRSESQQRVMMLTTTFKFSLATQFEPDYDPDTDPRLDLLYEVAELLDGVFFTPSSLRDAHGRVLYAADGEEDPEAVWPRVLAEVSIPDQQERPSSTEATSAAPSAERVARRALALAAVTARAILEQGGTNIRPQANWFQRLLASGERQRQELLAWLRDVGIEDELEPNEWEILQRPIGRLDQRQQIEATWRLEGLVVLGWALGRFDVPPHDQLVEFNALWRKLGLLEANVAKQLLTTATLRPQAEIESLRRGLFAVHWRLRNYHVHPGVMDFAEFARTCRFGPLDITGLPLVDGDLGLLGQRIDRAAADVFSLAHSIALERHLAANWLSEGPTRYSAASVAT